MAPSRKTRALSRWLPALMGLIIVLGPATAVQAQLLEVLTEQPTPSPSPLPTDPVTVKELTERARKRAEAAATVVDEVVKKATKPVAAPKEDDKEAAGGDAVLVTPIKPEPVEPSPVVPSTAEPAAAPSGRGTDDTSGAVTPARRSPTHGRPAARLTLQPFTTITHQPFSPLVLQPFAAPAGSHLGLPLPPAVADPEIGSGAVPVDSVAPPNALQNATWALFGWLLALWVVIALTHPRFAHIPVVQPIRQWIGLGRRVVADQMVPASTRGRKHAALLVRESVCRLVKREQKKP